MEKVAEMLIKLNLLNSRGTIIYLILAFVVLAVLISGIAKRLFYLTSIGVFLGLVCGAMFMLKVSLVDNNGLQFESVRVVNSSGQSLNYADIEKIEIRSKNRRLALVGKDGTEMVLKVDSSYAKALKTALENLGGIVSEEIEQSIEE